MLTFSFIGARRFFTCRSGLYKMRVHYFSLYRAMVNQCKLTILFSTLKYKVPRGILSLYSTKGLDVFLTAQKVNK